MTVAGELESFLEAGFENCLRRRSVARMMQAHKRTYTSSVSRSAMLVAAPLAQPEDLSLRIRSHFQKLESEQSKKDREANVKVEVDPNLSFSFLNCQLGRFEFDPVGHFHD